MTEEVAEWRSDKRGQEEGRQRGVKWPLQGGTAGQRQETSQAWGTAGQAPQEQWELWIRKKGNEGCGRSLWSPEVQPKGLASISAVSDKKADLEKGSEVKGAFWWKQHLSFLLQGLWKKLKAYSKMPFYFPGWQSKDDFAVFSFHSHFKRWSVWKSRV